MDKKNLANSYIFGNFHLDATDMTLKKGGVNIPITKKRLALLILLLENAGKLLSKDELINQIWPDQEVEESNLPNSVYALRQLIEEDSRNPQLIATVSGRGYKFIGDVQIVPAVQQPIKPEHPSIEHKQKVWTRLAIVIVVIFTLAGAGTYLTVRYRSSNTVSSAAVAFPIPLTSLLGTERYPALSEDGSMIAFTWNEDPLQNQDIYVKQTIGGQAVRITSDPNIELYPTWSPDGRYIAFLRQADEKGEPNHLVIIPALGGTEREIGRVDNGLDWSPDGKYLVVTGLHSPGGGVGLSLISVDGQESRRVSPKTGNEIFFDSAPRFSPDGRYIAFLRWKSDAGCDILIANLSDGKVRQVNVGRRSVVSDSLQWSVDGRRLHFIAKHTGYLNLWQVDSQGGEPTVVSNFSNQLTHYSIARKANMLAYVNELRDTIIRITNPAGKTCEINSSLNEHTPRFSPDGSMIAFSSDRTGGEEIWLAKSDCSEVRQLTNFNEVGVGSPRWSPDGARIAFDRRGNGESDIYTIAVNGTDLRKVTDSKGTNTMPNWSPDGRWIYFTSNRAAPYLKNQIWKVPATGGEAIKVTQNDGGESISSSDGQTIFFVHYNRIWQINLKTGEESPVVELKGMHVDRNWSVTSDSIFILSKIAGGATMMTRLHLKSNTVTTVSKVVGVVPEWDPALAVSSDNQQHAFCLVNTQLSDIMLVTGWR